MKKLLLTLFCLVIILQPAQAIKIIPKDVTKWTCYDYSADYTAKNNSWGCLTISENQNFRGVSHMVNYMFTPDKKGLQIHDGLYQSDYTVYSWENDTNTYYHFWTNATKPVRTYIFLYDNRKEVLCNLK